MRFNKRRQATFIGDGENPTCPVGVIMWWHFIPTSKSVDLELAYHRSFFSVRYMRQFYIRIYHLNTGFQNKEIMLLGEELRFPALNLCEQSPSVGFQHKVY